MFSVLSCLGVAATSLRISLPVSWSDLFLPVSFLTLFCSCIARRIKFALCCSSFFRSLCLSQILPRTLTFSRRLTFSPFLSVARCVMFGWQPNRKLNLKRLRSRCTFYLYVRVTLRWIDSSHKPARSRSTDGDREFNSVHGLTMRHAVVCLFAWGCLWRKRVGGVYLREIFCGAKKWEVFICAGCSVAYKDGR